MPGLKDVQVIPTSDKARTSVLTAYAHNYSALTMILSSTNF